MRMIRIQTEGLCTLMRIIDGSTRSAKQRARKSLIRKGLCEKFV